MPHHSSCMSFSLSHGARKKKKKAFLSHAILAPDIHPSREGICGGQSGSLPPLPLATINLPARFARQEKAYKQTECTHTYTPHTRNKYTINNTLLELPLQQSIQALTNTQPIPRQGWLAYRRLYARHDTMYHTVAHSLPTRPRLARTALL